MLTRTSIKAFLLYIWDYSATLAALSVYCGVLGMAVYHLFIKSPGEQYRDAKLARSYLGATSR